MDAPVSNGRSNLRATPTPILRHLAHFGPLTLLSATAAILAAERAVPGTSIILRTLYGTVVGLNALALAMTAWSAVLGACAGVATRAGWSLGGPVMAPPTGRARTALLLPIHEEDAPRVFAAARVTTDALAGARAGHVDCFVLSDSRSAKALADEQRMAALAARPDDGGPCIFYRRRVDNAGRKAGNIADFVERWGARYPFMIVLDADSLMSGDALARLVGIMEANPRAGIVQAMCYPVGRQSRFARLQQFSSRILGPLFQRGVSFWQGPRGNFWGHNAIVRTAAFAESCGLPRLPGAPPLGGEILSHDTVEAALLLRRGYDVWMLPDGPGGRHDGSWEETPTNLVDHLDRDRRWCRGNLQHIHVLAADGLQPASLYHLIRGLLHFFYAPLFVAWLALYALIDRRGATDALWWLIVALIAAPRLLALAAAISETDQAPAFGGRAALVTSFVADQLFAALIFPIALVVHLQVLVSLVAGGETRWDGQMRDDRGLTWRATARQLAAPLLSGLAGLALLGRATLLPATLLAPGLLCAVPLAVLTSRRLVSPWLFRTPDDGEPHPIRAARARIETLLRQGRKIDLDAVASDLPAEAGLPMPTQRLRAR